MQSDIAIYRHHLDGFDMSEARKDEIIRAVSHIMESFVDLAFGIDSTQILLGIDGNEAVGAAADPVGLSRLITSTFNDTAHEGAVGKTIP